MRSNKAFTLVELLVAMSCAAIVLTMVTTSLIFLLKINRQSLNQSESLVRQQAVQSYIIHHSNGTLPKPDEYSAQNGSVFRFGSLIAKDTDIQSIAFDSVDGFIRCTFECGDSVYHFIVGVHNA